MLRINLLALIATNIGSAIFTAGFVLLIVNTPRKPKTVRPRLAAGSELIGWPTEIAQTAELDEPADDGWDDDDDYPRLRHRKLDEGDWTRDGDYQPAHGTPEPQPEPEPVTNRHRFTYAASVEMRERADRIAADKAAMQDLADRINSGVEWGTHHESDHITPDLERILADARWGSLNEGELTAALTAARVGMPTGQYPVVVTSGGGSTPPGTPTPGVPVPPKPQIFAAIHTAALASKAGA